MAAMVPLAGDPTMLRAAAQDHLDTAVSIRDAASALRALANRIQTRSNAVDAVRTVAEDVSDIIVKAEVRYSGTADALRVYSFALESAQTRASNAISANTNSESELNAARYNMAEAEERAHRDTPERLQAIDEYGRWKQRVRDLEDRVGEAEGQYESAVIDLNDAALIAIAAINSAIEKSGLNDSIFDRMREAWNDFCEFWEEYVAPLLSAMQEIIKLVAEILGYLALILAFIPGMQALAGAIALIALGLHALSLVLTVVLMLSGDRTIGDVIKDVIDVALAAIPFAGKFGSAVTGGVLKEVAAGMVKGGLGHVLTDVGKEIVIDVVGGGIANNIDQTIEAFSTGDWQDLPVPGPLPLGGAIHLLSGVEVLDFDGFALDIPGLLTDDVPTLGDYADAVSGDLLGGLGASLRAGLTPISVVPLVGAR